MLYEFVISKRYAIILFTDIQFYCQMKKLYSWPDVARRTEIVYNRALKCSNPPLLDRLSRYATILKVNNGLSMHVITLEK